MNEQAPSKEQFKSVEDFEGDGMRAWVDASGEQLTMEGCAGSSFQFFPHEIRALRDWFNKVLP
jgi:hypothetical protein